MAIYLYDGKILTEGNAIAIHVDCCCGTNETWLKCSDDTAAAIFTAVTAPTTDYAWLCLSSIWVKCYASGTTGGAATTPVPDILYQCDVPAPTACADLVGWPMSDFGSGPCPSVNKTGDNWLYRWAETLLGANSAVTHTGSSVVLSTIANGSTQYALMDTYKSAGHAGDFTETCDFSITGFDPGGGQIQTGYGVKLVGGSIYYIFRRIQPDGTQELLTYFNGVYTIAASSVMTSTFTVQRVGSTWTMKMGGVTIKTGSGSTAALATLYLFCTSLGSGATPAVTYDNVSCLDGSSGEIYVDPSGEAC